MIRDVKVIHMHDKTDSQTISLEIPKSCPCCGVTYDRSPLCSYYSEKNEEHGEVFSLYGCPSCDSLFVIRYSWDWSYSGANTTLLSEFPYKNQQTSFPDDIRALSPQFVEIFQQAEKSERHELSEICGMGYRKALEFLVKDYAIHSQPDHTEEIKKAALGPCINKYIQDDKIKALATASAWIGNDETHYVRKHEDYNVEHLKRFIKTIVAFITFNLSVEEAQALINSQKKPHS